MGLCSALLMMLYGDFTEKLTYFAEVCRSGYSDSGCGGSVGCPVTQGVGDVAGTVLGKGEEQVLRQRYIAVVELPEGMDRLIDAAHLHHHGLATVEIVVEMFIRIT